MIIRTEAVVLRSIDYGETSEIVTLFTREKGKLAVMAKGARRAGSRFGSSLQPTSYTQVVFYYKPGRSVQTLSESTHVRSLHGITRDLPTLSYGLRIVELVHALLQDHEQNPMVFNLLVDVLDRLSRSPARMPNLFHFFQLRLASILGFAPDIQREDLEGIPNEGGYLSLETGAVLRTSEGAGAARRASRRALRAFGVLARTDLDTAMRMRLRPELIDELEELIEEFFRYHVEDAYPSRSSRIIGQMLGLR